MPRCKGGVCSPTPTPATSQRATPTPASNNQGASMPSQTNKMTSAQRKAANKKVNEIKALIAAERSKGVTPENEGKLKELEGFLAEAQANTSKARQKWESFKRGLGGLPTSIVDSVGGVLEAIGATNTPGEIKQSDIYTPEQRATIDALRQYGLEALQKEGNFQPIQDALSQVMAKNLVAPNEEALKPYQDLLNQRIAAQQSNVAPYEKLLQEQIARTPKGFDFAPFKQKAEQQFAEQTLPGIFERFNTLGKGAQSTGAFQGMLARGAADLNTGLAALEQDYALKNRPLDQQQQQLLQNLLGQQQNYGLQGQQIAGNILGQQQSYGLNKAQLGNEQQRLLQGLLGQQQGYDLSRRGLGLDVLRQGLQSPFQSYYQPGQEGWGGQALKAGIDAAIRAAFI